MGKLLIFYNKNTGKIIGYHHPTIFIVDDINKAFIYDKEIIDVDNFLQIFTKCSPYGNGIIFKIYSKYFNGVNKNDISYKYLDYNICLRKQKIDKLCSNLVIK